MGWVDRTGGAEGNEMPWSPELARDGGWVLSAIRIWVGDEYSTLVTRY